MIVNRTFEEIHRLHFQGRKVSEGGKQQKLLAICFMVICFSVNFSILKMEAICFPETAVDPHRNT